jgi:selenocysteine-specific elongation factor
MKVIGTAGHIDHGKSALVQRLTGIDPDRLAEEKRRGMTLDLGFAWLRLPGGVEVSIVDVPGHERFVKNMLAGTGGIDLALLVVAANEGVMPQTLEHVDILDLLSVGAGVVAVTKSDTVRDEQLAMVVQDVRDLIAGTALAESSIIPVSSITGEGIAELLDALAAGASQVPTRPDHGNPFLPIDRVFTMSGFGTVVTGTLSGGALRIGQEIEIAPAGRRARIRGLQTHRSPVELAEPGTRVAANLAGVSREDIARGDVVSLPGRLKPVARFDARVRVVPGAPFALEHGLEATLHIGAAERAVTIRILGQNALQPGEVGWVQVRCREAVVAQRRQRFILRLPSPARTVAGGQVADLHPRRRRFDSTEVQRLNTLLGGTIPEVILAGMAGRRTWFIPQIAAATGFREEETQAAIDCLVERGQIVSLGASYVPAKTWEGMRRLVSLTLEAYHSANPMRRGMPREQLRATLGWSTSDWTAALRLLTLESVIREEGAFVAASGHAGGIGHRRDDADRVLAVLRGAPFSPPTGRDLLQACGADGPLLVALTEAGEIVRIAEGLYFARDAYDRAVRTIVDLIRSSDAVTVAAVRDAIGTSRKYAVALLEHLDSERITKRIGDSRVLGIRYPASG